MNSAPIDILLAVYNGERYLGEFLESLAAQTCRDFRLVVSDNKSTDGTVRLIEGYAARWQYGISVLPPPAETTSAHSNFARVSQAGQAPYLMFADGDDVWHPDKVEKTFAAMQQAERKYGATAPILAHSDLAVVDERLKRMHASLWRFQHLDPRRTRLNQLLMQNCVTGCTTMLNRALFDLGSPIPAAALVHDHWYALIAAAFGHIVRIEEPLIEYRQHGSNVTGAKRWGAAYVLDHARRLYRNNGGRNNLGRNIEQAQSFLIRYGNRLSPPQRAAVEAFTSLRQRNIFDRRWQLFRHRLWKTGLLRNIGVLLAV